MFENFANVILYASVTCKKIKFFPNHEVRTHSTLNDKIKLLRLNKKMNTNPVRAAAEAAVLRLPRHYDVHQTCCFRLIS